MSNNGVTLNDDAAQAILFNKTGQVVSLENTNGELTINGEKIIKPIVNITDSGLSNKCPLFMNCADSNLTSIYKYNDVDGLKVYKNERVSWTFYAEQNADVFTTTISSTVALNLFDIGYKRLEYSKTGTDPNNIIPGSKQWVYDSVGKTLEWTGSDIEVTVEATVLLEKTAAGNVLVKLYPTLNGSATNSKIIGNYATARIARNNSTSVRCNFTFCLETGDKLQLLLDKTNGTTASGINIRYSDIKIYTYRCQKLSHEVYTDI